MSARPQPASLQFSQLQRDLGRMSTVQRRLIRQAAEQIGQSALSDAKSRASWSRRIPSAISMRGFTDTTRGRVGVELRVSKSVPYARAYEGISQQGSSGYFRHPVFGNRQVWVSQQTRPYLWPAVSGRRNQMLQAIEQVVEQAAREAGFR